MGPAAFVAFNAVLLGAAASDLRRYAIPNRLPAALAIAGLALAFPGDVGEALSRLGSAALVSLIGGLLWLRGVFGGGDLKLLAACALWIPLSGLPSFAMAFGLASGVQGLATLGYLRVAGGAPMAGAMRARLPYALSIAAAGLVWSVTRLPG